MATGFQVDELPLIPEDSPPVSGEWEHVPYLKEGEEKLSEPNNYSLLQEDYYDDEEDEENGVKGVADVDFIPENDTCIELQKG